MFSIRSIRERRAFWGSRPRGVLIATLTTDACIGIAIGRVGLAELRPLPRGEVIFVFAYKLFASLIVNDLVKLRRGAVIVSGPIEGSRGPGSI